MTWEELEKIEAFLKENGYRKDYYLMHRNSHYYWWKTFGKDCKYQVLLNVYDWREHWNRDPYLRELNKAASITAIVSVSRTINKPSIALSWDLKNVEDLKDIEDKTYNLWRYVEDNFKDI